MLKVGDEALCVKDEARLFSKAPYIGELCKVVDVSSNGSHIKVGGFHKWYSSTSFASPRNYPTTLDELGREMEDSTEVWRSIFARDGKTSLIGQVALQVQCLNILLKEVKSLRGEIDKLKGE